MSTRKPRPFLNLKLVSGLSAVAIGAVALLMPSHARSADMPGTMKMETTPVTYAHDIAPVLYDNCVNCHHDGGGGPFSLMTYKDASKKGALLAQVTASHQMPPWKAEQGFGSFENERHLTPAQIDLFQRWSDAGMPSGDLATAPKPPTFDADSSWTLGKPDLIVKVPESYSVPADGRDIYRCFIVPLNLTEDHFVSAVQFKPSNKSVVHHALLYLDRTGAATRLNKSYHDEHADDTQIGYPHFGGPGFLPGGSLGGWAPGALPSFLPEGVARPLQKDANLVIQTHFHPTGKPEVEQSEVGIYFSKTPPVHTLTGWVLRNRKIDIAAGEKNYTVTDDFTLPVDVTIVGITPHAHLICRQMDVWATPPNSGDDAKKTPLIRIPDWDFNWQGTYRYATPVKLPAGTTVHMKYVYDNTADNERNPNTPPARVHYGEQTVDEMALCFFEGYTDNPNDTAKLRLSMFRRLRPGGS